MRVRQALTNWWVAEVVKELLQALPELAMTVDASNTTALNTAATQGHMEVVRLLLEVDASLVLIARSNGKTAVHSAARNGHVEVVRALLEAEPSIALRVDKKGQTALHMAAKGTSLDLFDALLAADATLLNLPDTKGNTALHIASRKARHQIIKRLLELPDTNLKAINRSGETPLDTAEKMGNGEVAGVLAENGVVSARALSPTGGGGNPGRELKQQVSDIKHEVHSQLEQTRQTRVRMQGIQKRINKLHEEGLNNAINSTTVVAVLIATVAFAAIFTVPGEYVDADSLGPGQELGEANIAHETPFIIFFVFDSVALFISLAVVVVQTSVVVIERKAKKQMMAVINKLMWVACVLISVAFLALSFVVVGRTERWLAVAVTVMGATILVTTIGTMLYWVIAHRIEAKRLRSIKRSSMSRSRSHSGSGLSEHDWVDEEFKKMYAI
jgi:ankyrin repeat protein